MRESVMRAKLICLLTLAAAAAAGAASGQQAGQIGSEPMRLARDLSMSAPRPVFAVIGHHLLSGELKPDAPLTALADARQPTFSCAPSQRGRRGSEITLSCTDGTSALVTLDDTGCGRSKSGEPASMCIGMPAKYAARRLTAPAGQTLRIDGEKLVLDPPAGG
jgi:hypothetical protein